MLIEGDPDRWQRGRKPAMVGSNNDRQESWASPVLLSMFLFGISYCMLENLGKFTKLLNPRIFVQPL
jgi:hypothetical protein